MGACTAAPAAHPHRHAQPRGKTLPAAELLQREFDAVGAQTEIIATPTPGVVHFIARLKGSGEQPPVLLAAHSDVVPFDTAQWTVDPLGGEIKDGWVYGRGAMDFKGGLAVFGIYPYPMDNDTLERMHGNDERIEASSLREGAEMIYRTLRQVAAP